jgi:cytochrome c oxidase subunit IV
MSTKTLIWTFLVIFSTIGSYLPSLFGLDMFSLWSIIGGALGGILGIYVGYKLGENWGLS